MKIATKITVVGSVLSAFFASVCCVGPVIFAALGVGAVATGFLASTAQFAKALIPYRPFFIGLTFLLLGMGLYSVYRKKTPCCATDSICGPNTAKKTKIALWVITGLAVILMLIPYFLEIGS